jgi:Uma2 family endonuclease
MTMSCAPRYVPHYTLDDYRQWEGDWELIDGVAIAMTPSPFAPYERVISRLSRIIGTQIEQNSCPCEVYTNLDWIVSQDTVIRPDLMVVCGDQPQRHLERPPVLVAEVMSESTKGRDRIAKRAVYVEQRVRYFLVIDPDAKTVVLATGESTCLFAADGCVELELADQGSCKVKIDCQRLFD